MAAFVNTYIFSQAGTLVKLDQNAVPIWTVSAGTGNPGTFASVAVDKDGNPWLGYLFETGTNYRKAIKYDQTNGTPLLTIHVPDAFWLTAIGTDQDGDVWLGIRKSGAGNNRLVKYDGYTGTILYTVNYVNVVGNVTHGFIPVDKFGNIWRTAAGDFNNNGVDAAITKLSSTGLPLVTNTNVAPYIRNAVTDSTGDVWAPSTVEALDNTNGYLVKYDKTTALQIVTIDLGINEAGSGITIDSSDNVWALLDNTGVIVKYSSAGVPIVTVNGLLDTGAEARGELSVDVYDNVWAVTGTGSDVTRYITKLSPAGFPLATYYADQVVQVLGDFTGQQYINGGSGPPEPSGPPVCWSFTAQYA